MERISKLPLSDADAWKEEIDKNSLRIENFFVTTGDSAGRDVAEQDGSWPRRIRSSALEQES